MSLAASAEDRPNEVRLQLDELEALVKSINDFWLKRLALPAKLQSR